MLASKVTSLEPVPRTFYSRGTVTVARELLGKYLVRIRKHRLLIGKIVEDEAYRGRDDPASHAFRGPTPRNMPMFGESGHAYIYFTYGNHYCLNMTTQKVGTPAAVLIRAVQPLKGIDVMRRLRPGVPDSQLTSGPGKLTKAFDIDKTLNKLDLTKRGPLFIAHGTIDMQMPVARSARIGITIGKERLWRFYAKSNLYVSRG